MARKSCGSVCMCGRVCACGCQDNRITGSSHRFATLEGNSEFLLIQPVCACVRVSVAVCAACHAHRHRRSRSASPAVHLAARGASTNERDLARCREISQHRDRSYTTRTTLALNKSQQNMYNQTASSASTAVSPAAFFFFSAKTQSTNTKSENGTCIIGRA